MAGSMAGNLLLCTLVVLSLVHLVLAEWSSQVYEENEWYSKKPLGRKLAHRHARKKHRHAGRDDHHDDAFYDSDEGFDEYIEEGSTDGEYGEPHYYKPKPKPKYYRFKPKPVFKAPPPAPSSYPKPQSPPKQEASPPPPPPPPPEEAPPIYAKSPATLAPPPAIILAPPPYKRPQPSPPPFTPPTTFAPPPYKKPEPSYKPAPTVPSPATPPSWAQEWLGPHNAARGELGLPPMVWSDIVAQFAQSWANQRKASGCGLQHSTGPYGENIFWGSGGSYGPAECVGAWVSEKKYYNYADNSCAPGQQCGHYTQIVWATSLNLGCAKVQCDSGQIFMTCNYDPPGNWIGSKPY
ncbi:hypothetical protein GOP47_0004672 [Adiantum capillus-veneris]|uniref:SCP domain-containing protein n=1 Tax=Adiantum capillus-veneris TaxID=13818 RepID=A0A9D4ZN12_ADICA|nr:hypothetical protein GOP47_0004672 [Adiantum capillus-veneris]